MNGAALAQPVGARGPSVHKMLLDLLMQQDQGRKVRAMAARALKRR
jgi:hypothetical protein